jgi:hypothetical protein
MKAFVMFGDMEFFGGGCLIHRVLHTEVMNLDDIEGKALDLGGWDYVIPHHFDGTITFMKHGKEQT